MTIDVKSTGFKLNNWGNVITVGTGGNREKYGDATPGIYMTDLTEAGIRPHFVSAINGNPNWVMHENIPDVDWKATLPKINEVNPYI